MRLAVLSIAALAFPAAAGPANGTKCCGTTVFAGAGPQAAQSAPAKQIGTIKAINGNTITLTTEAGANITVVVQDSARMVRVEPGETTLANAMPLRLSELQAGDRIIVRGQPSSDAKSFVASGIIAMKHADVEAKRKSELDDWKKRGIGGVVTAVDAGTATITISNAALGANKSVAIHTTQSSILRRYSPDSVRFEDAKSSTFDQIKPGDQVLARGNRGADGSEFAAEEIVSGLFRDIAGTISAIDAAANTAAVTDLLTTKSVLVRVTAETQVRKLPPELAQRIAMRLHRVPPGGAPATPGTSSSAASAGAQGPSGTAPGSTAGPGSRPGGAPDMQQIMNRLPPASLSDLQKGDAVMILSTEGTDSGKVTAIKVLAGVEPILAAAPKGAQAMALSPWTIGSSAEAGAGADANP